MTHYDLEPDTSTFGLPPRNHDHGRDSDPKSLPPVCGNTGPKFANRMTKLRSRSTVDRSYLSHYVNYYTIAHESTTLDVSPGTCYHCSAGPILVDARRLSSGCDVLRGVTIQMSTRSLTLSNGECMPVIGIGSYAGFRPAERKKATAWLLTALQAGYRHIDTASLHGKRCGQGHQVVWHSAGQTIRDFETPLAPY
ncbi:hypothetical protein BV22DRAFT_854592 [Leucogyrophana mollusca]|uniref:Uncharacterized protein n=1 Tax=Leucogyrophana mollusca TaxID=85980 RepID=A0ACB8B208_9AGAM|nr:hypothetical protein BV22DRAFT_854592 [Leucogyrophana mollusca]